MKLLVAIVVTIILGICVGLVHARWTCTGIQEQFRPLSMDSVAEMMGVEMMGVELIVDEDNEDRPIATIVGGNEYDFGSMERRGTRSHTFVIRNDGTQPLSLKKGETTCKCTLSSLAQELVAPGEAVEIKLDWTAKEVGMTSEFNQSAEIYTNDPANRLVRLVVRGQIIQSVLPRPEVMTMNNISSGETYTATTGLYCYRDTVDRLEVMDFELLGATPLGFVEIRFEPMSAEQVAKEPHATSGQVMHVKLKPGMKSGLFSQTIRVKTNLPDAPRVDVFLNGEVVQDITVFGRGFRASEGDNPELFGVLNLGSIASGTGLEHNIIMVVKGAFRDDVSFSVESVSPAGVLDVELGSATVVGKGKTVHHKLLLAIKPGQAAANFVGGNRGNALKIVLKTTHPNTPEISISVVFSITQ
jgi:hypothetical protein